MIKRFLFLILIFLFCAALMPHKIVTIVGSGITDYTADANCMGAWFLNGSGTETDRSGEGGTLTETGTVDLLEDECADVDDPHDVCTGSGTATGEVPSGYSGKSRNFQGSDDVLEHADGNSTDISGATPLSIVAWVYADDVSDNTNYAVVTKYDSNGDNRQYYLGLKGTSASTSKIHAVLSSNGADSTEYFGDTTTIPEDTWTHIALVYNRTDVRLYLNGSLDTASPTARTSDLPNKGAAFYIGARDNSGGYLYDWDGLIDEPAIFDRELTSSEISDIYTNGLDGTKGSND